MANQYKLDMSTKVADEISQLKTLARQIGLERDVARE